MKFKLTSMEKKWVLYDVGNSAFTLMVSTIFPIYFNYLAESAGISDVDYLAYWGYAVSISTLLVAFLGPTLGAVADTKNYKKIIFGATMGVGVAGCILPVSYTHLFKDRGAAVLIAHCKAIGVESVVQDSSGNAGNSVAAYCARARIACEIYVPEGTSPKTIDMIRAHGATVHIVPGSRAHCADVCRKQVQKSGKDYASHVYNLSLIHI